MKQAGIYKISSNGQIVYVGQAQNLERRFAHHRSCLSKGTHANSYLQRIHDKYDDLQYEVLVTTTNVKELTMLEIRYINALNPLCNSTMPGENDTWVFSSERNAKIAAALLGVPKSEEHRKNISLAKMGEKNPQYGKPAWNRGKPELSEGELNPFYGKHHSEESKKRISESKRKPVDSKQLLELLSLGLSHEQIAYDLGVSRKTIDRRVAEWQAAV